MSSTFYYAAQFIKGILTMSIKPFAITIVLLVSAAATPGVMAQSISAGQQAYAQCIACHATSAANGVGPGLQGIVGRASASQPGFRYSPAMKRVKLTWDEKTLDAYVQNPQAVVPGNLMPYSGLADAKQRADLIAYLATLK
jgi:cytochrome c